MHTLQQLASGELKGTKEIRMSCGLTEFPEELFSLSDNLEVLDLSGNRLSRLPADFGRFSQLRIVFLSDNLFTELPEVLSGCKQLSMIGFKSNKIAHIPETALPLTTRWLILTNNQLGSIPASIGKCSLLQKCALAGNQLTALPPEMANCRNLELLRISANRFTGLPGWLLELPKLSWLAFSGNPFSHVPEAIRTLPSLDWKEFDLLDLLGEGASGHIFKAAWKTGSVPEVAIKVFKGEVTSDGFPEDEMQASIAAGTHPGLVNLLGEIKNHPQQKHGLVMSLIPATFRNLGMSPSLESCSRDTFKEGTVFTGAQILKIAAAIASLTSHLHERGIMHGDLYAHNILIDKNDTTLMGDFGAASFFIPGSPEARSLQKIESRAFGCLLDDLLTYLSEEDKKLQLSAALRELCRDLMGEPEQRPVFDEIDSRLKKME